AGTSRAGTSSSAVGDGAAPPVPSPSLCTAQAVWAAIATTGRASDPETWRAAEAPRSRSRTSTASSSGRSSGTSWAGGGAVCPGGALRLRLRPSEQGRALHGEGGGERRQGRGQLRVPVAGPGPRHLLRAGESTLEQLQQIRAVEVVDAGRGRRVLLRPAQRDPPAAHEREQRRDARGTEQGAAGRGGRRRVSGTGHGRILASQAPVEARTGPGHYPGGIGPGAPRASQTPIAAG